MKKPDPAILQFLREQKGRISQYLRDWLVKKSEETELPLLADTIDLILNYSLGGKMIRGSLVLLGKRLYEPEASWDRASLGSASSMELAQSFLLIHDDIMDRDEVRRGMPSFHMQYLNRMWAQYPQQPESELRRISEALAICAGDIANFLTNEILVESQNSAEIASALSRLLNRELVKVGVGQLQDVAWSLDALPPDPEQVLRMYELKTGRYTFSLPLLMGAQLLEGISPDMLSLSRIGDLLGVIFQIRDDEIGLTSGPETSGKPKASDLWEKKKTIYTSVLYSRLPSDQGSRFVNFYAGKGREAEDVEWLMNQMSELGVFQEVQDLREHYLKELEDRIDRLDLPDPASKHWLLDLSRYCNGRDS